MIYNGRECVIEVSPVQAVNGFVTAWVTISEGGAVLDSHALSIALQALRTRSDANATDIQTERDAWLSQAVADAEDRFRDIVDAESL
jgi:hypothetical protein